MDKRTKDKLKSQLRNYRRSIRTGEYRNLPIFDEEKHLQFYCELLPAYTTGFKTAFLRTVQRKLDILTLRLEGAKDWSEVAREIPTTTLGRLNYLSETGVISQTDAQSTGEAYIWFLRQYHLIQENYKQDGNKIATQSYDREPFEQYRQDIEQFSNI